MSKSFKDGLDRLRSRWPQSFVAKPKGGGDFLVAVPGVLLPPGYNKTICTLLFLSLPPVSPITEFWIDLPDLLLANGEPPKRSCVCGGPFDAALPRYGNRGGIWDGVPGFPEWTACRLFLWRQQAFNINRETIFTSAMVCLQRLKLAR